jgi:hypothetical protein
VCSKQEKKFSGVNERLPVVRSSCDAWGRECNKINKNNGLYSIWYLAHFGKSNGDIQNSKETPAPSGTPALLCSHTLLINHQSSAENYADFLVPN